MSFAAQVKAEICREDPLKRCCALAECCGVLLYCNAFGSSGIRIVTESSDFAARLPRLFKRAFSVNFDTVKTESHNGKNIFQITDPSKINIIFQAMGISPEVNYSLHVNFALLEEECCRASFVRGAFLAGGSVTDPEKRYHLELACSHLKVSRETLSLLLDLGFYPKETMRNGSSILYFKQSDAIEDVLTFLGAPVCAMAVMEAKLEKDMKNKINRIVNCDNANTSKIVEAAQEQISAIKKLQASGAFDTLSEKLKQTAKLRLDNPEANLSELADMMEPPITKSAVNHRLRKLIELSEE